MRRLPSHSKKHKRLPTVFLLCATIPTAVLLIVFMVIPTVQAVLLSFREVNILTMKGEFVGLSNYLYMFKDRMFKLSFTNTIKLMVVIPLVTLTVSFLLAFVLQQVKLREKNLYITFYFFPYFLSATVVAAVWSYVLHPTTGILNKLLSLLGLESLKHAWVGDAGTALWCIAAVIIWACIGYYIVLYLSSLESIPEDLYEAATLDGATFWDKLRYITLPLMRGTIGTTFILLMSGVIGTSFVYSNLLTNGGPNGASNVLMQYVYTQGIKNGNTGYASAITVVAMTLGILLSVISRKMTQKSAKE